MDGVKVVEIGVWVAGPAAGGILADWGADVVKIEPPAGDPARTFQRMFGADMPNNPVFELDNRSKRSVVLDLGTDEGRALALELIDGADVFLTNIRASALARIGLDHETLLARNPRLVYAIITGYGLEGPDADRAAYDIAAFWARSGIAHLLTPPDANPPFQRGGMDIAFDDRRGRPVHLRIVERGKPSRPFAILAPMGNTAAKPPALPLFFLHGFYFVRRANTDLLISVDGRAHKPDSIPMLLDSARVHFLRYAAEPFLVNWNPAREGELPGRPLPPNAGELEDGPAAYRLAWRGGQPEVAAISLNDGRHTLRAAFTPPFPHAVALADGATAAGTFAITTDGAGTVSGRYRLARAGAAVEIILHPDGGWQPAVKRWSVRLIFGLVPLFKRWPMTYRWVGRLALGERPALHGAWERLGREGQGRVIKLFGD